MRVTVTLMKSNVGKYFIVTKVHLDTITSIFYYVNIFSYVFLCLKTYLEHHNSETVNFRYFRYLEHHNFETVNFRYFLQKIGTIQ